MTRAVDPRVTCRTPNPEKPSVTRLPKWKFDVLRGAILAELEREHVRFSELSERVKSQLSAEDLADMGSLGWHVTSVKLELEVRGEIARVSDKTPQVLQLGASAPTK